ncbi:MAG: hypothetical protein LBM75_01345 [Myxococcales bacterium]|jgi:nitroreductase|nr:hypothetical protein [Myxococcales bacterium]
MTNPPPSTPTTAEPAIVQTIRQRTSWRAYTGEPLGDATLEQLRTAIAELETPFGNEPRFEILITAESGSIDLRGMATYGVLRNPPAFLAGAIAPGPHALEDFAFAFESIVLRATELGLGTCWIAGSFSRSRFSRALRLGVDELLPAISPLGQPTSERGLRDRLMRFSGGSQNRKPWSELFFDGDIAQPLTEAKAGQAYATALEMVRLGPSARNRQPWRIVRSDDGKHFDLYVFRESGLLTRVQPGGIDMARLDAGIALCHFERTARALGLPGEWRADEAPAGKVPEAFEFIASWQIA